MFVRVVVLSPVHVAGDEEPLFDYHLPDELIGRVGIGSLVTVDFHGRPLYAVVVDQPGQPAVAETKPVGELVDPAPVLDAVHIELARWMSRETLTPLHECLLQMLPPGVVGLTDARLTVVGELPAGRVASPLERRLLDVLTRRGPLLGRQLDRAFPRSDWRAAADRLVQRGVLERTSVLAPPRVTPKQVATVRLLPGVDQEAALRGLRAPVYPRILDFLRREGGPVDVSWVYAETQANRDHLDRLAQRGLVAFDVDEVWRDPLEGKVFLPTTPLPLTPDQQVAWTELRSAIGDQRSAIFLLHGVTGSGKTELYLRAVDEVLAQGRKAIVLVPEISLTPQTVARFAGRFPGRVSVIHSQLTEGQRYDVWRRARAGQVDVVVGPRSALFTPLAPLGLIVLDEEHDGSYKQASRPTYHARETAVELARLTGATVILGSATPSLESFVRAQRGDFRLLTLSRRILGHARRLTDLRALYHAPGMRYRPLWDGPPEARTMPLPPVLVVDMRAELKAGNLSIFSRTLQRALDEALGRGEQAILFLNRRGAATFVLCRDCGTVARCPSCGVPLTLHVMPGEVASGHKWGDHGGGDHGGGDHGGSPLRGGGDGHSRRGGPPCPPHGATTEGRPYGVGGGYEGSLLLICHHCGRREPPPERCPHCGSVRVRPFGLGTQGLEQAVRQRWPEARLLRWDRDTARTAEAHWAILQRFADGQADVLIGTQMIAKGLDLPLVTLVGVISADTALDLPDFRAAERTFQLLEQVAGRAGRGLLGGRVVVQTYHPDHYAVRAAERHDYAGFVRRELAAREELGYPPAVRIARLLIRHSDPQRAEVAARDLAARMREALVREGLPASDLIGPAPAYFTRLRGRYRWQIILRHADPPGFLRRVGVPPGWLVDIDALEVL